MIKKAFLDPKNENRITSPVNNFLMFVFTCKLLFMFFYRLEIIQWKMLFQSLCSLKYPEMHYNLLKAGVGTNFSIQLYNYLFPQCIDFNFLFLPSDTQKNTGKTLQNIEKMQLKFLKTFHFPRTWFYTN